MRIGCHLQVAFRAGFGFVRALLSLTGHRFEPHGCLRLGAFMLPLNYQKKCTLVSF